METETKQSKREWSTHLHSETKTKLTTTASGRWKHKKSKNTWQEETRNTKWKWFLWLTTDSTKMIQQQGGISKWYINREPWWENKDSKHNRMTWMKVSASKHTQTSLWNPKFGFANLKLWNYLWHNYYMHVDMLKESITFALETGFWK